MRIDDLAGDVADVLVADAGVVLALRRREAAAGGKAERERRRGRGSTPARSRTTCPGSSGIVARLLLGCGVPSGSEHLAHDERAVLPGRVGEDRDRLQHAVRVAALRPAASSCRRSPRRGAPRAPGSVVELLDLRLAAEVRDGLVAVEPDVFELELGHPLSPVVLVCRRRPFGHGRQQKKAPGLDRVLRPRCLAPPAGGVRSQL